MQESQEGSPVPAEGTNGNRLRLADRLGLAPSPSQETKPGSYEADMAKACEIAEMVNRHSSGSLGNGNSTKPKPVYAFDDGEIFTS
jgi:hypothetical protein